MKNKRTIKNIFESWGQSKKELPPNNNALKSEILSKVPSDLGKTFAINHSRLPWVSFAFTAVAVVVFFINLAGPQNNFGKQAPTLGESSVDFYKTSSNRGTSAPSMPSLDNYYTPPFYGGGDSPITDNREFLKIGYNATVRTRRAPLLAARIETLIRGFGGRIDSASSGEKSGYISFALPKEELSTFQLAIKDLAGARFYTEQTNSQNLLPQKQMIEENQRQNEKNLSDLNAERGQIVRSHNQVVASHQSRVDSINRDIATLNAEYPSADAARRAQILNIINQLQAEINTIRYQIANENKSYQTKISDIDNKIRNTQENLRIIKNEDTNLINNVATVNGTISLTWINLWELADAYAPGRLLAWVFLLAAIAYYLFWHRRFIAVPDYF